MYYNNCIDFYNTVIFVITLGVQNVKERKLPSEKISKFETTNQSAKIVYPTNSSIVEGFDISLSEGIPIIINNQIK